MNSWQLLFRILTQHKLQSASSYVGYNYFSSVREKAECVIHVSVRGCEQGTKDASTASSAAAKYFNQSTLHNGRGDAFRHCYWNALMTHHIGAANAEIIATNHEKYSKGPKRETNMDLANNRTERTVGRQTKTDSQALARCRDLANHGKLVTLK
ncbi:DUF6973 domain-containing protein [Parascardovia denticolens]